MRGSRRWVLKYKNDYGEGVVNLQENVVKEERKECGMITLGD